MARAPRRNPQDEIADETDAPFRDALLRDSENVAEQFASIVEEFGGTSDGSVKGHLYKVQRSGKFEWIGEYWPPFDQAEIFREVRENYNGGDFQMRIMVQGRRGVQKTLTFAVAPAPHRDHAPKDNSGEMFPLMMQMMQGSSDRQMQMMMQMSQQSQAMFAQMNQSQQAMMAALIPAMMGGREKTSDIVQMVAALKGDDKGGMAGMFEAMKSAKELFGGGGDGGGLDADDLVGSAVKLAGPIMGALGRVAEQRRGVEPPPQTVTPLHVQPQHRALAVPAPEAAPLALDLPEHAPSRFPLLDIVRDDVLFNFGKGRSADFTASVVMELLDERGTSEAEFNELIAAFTLSPDWLSDLAAEGIDLRSQPEWANAFLAELVRLYADVDDGDEHPERRDGGDGDAGDDAKAGAAGVDGHAGAGDGGKPN